MSPANSGAPLPSAHELASRVVEPGESILWTGRPDTAVLVGASARRSPFAPLRGLITLALPLGVAFWLLRDRFGDELDSPAQILESLPREAWFGLIGVLVIILLGPLLRTLGFDEVSRMARWADSLTYVLTDRRALILEGEKVRWELSPEEVSHPRLRERASGYADVMLLPGNTAGSSTRTSRPGRESGQIAFKALPDAASVLAKVETWIGDHRERAESEVEDFVDATSTSYSAGTTDGARRMTQPRFGLRIDVPEEWSVKVRRRRKPFGKVFLDRENWAPPEELEDWNVLHVDGPAHCSVEIHFDEVPELLSSLDDWVGGFLVKAIAGEVIASEREVRRGSFRGFSVTRRLVVPGHGTSRVDREHGAFQKATHLHDGRLQVVVIETWPESSDTLERAVKAIASSMRFG